MMIYRTTGETLQIEEADASRPADCADKRRKKSIEKVAGFEHIECPVASHSEGSERHDHYPVSATHHWHGEGLTFLCNRRSKAEQNDGLR
ncbi:hypothetical protein SAMN05216387_10286 [Nitrosovibrio tenuis]|uniref:Uncharacterized protein n=1 Tax=Nitrosovibrio tenuis TaxID=1233 RepID=A0A1H7I7Q4_9PROT|nr:hypothetical protein SAMN05216387_10286 [Nitrosovibrio tenuis]